MERDKLGNWKCNTEPEPFEPVLVTTEDDGVLIMELDEHDNWIVYDGKRFVLYEKNVVAWKNAPQPYKRRERI